MNLCVLPLVGIVNQCVLSGRRSAIAGWGCVNLRVLPHLPEGEPVCSVRAAIATTTVGIVNLRVLPAGAHCICQSFKSQFLLQKFWLWGVI